MDIFTVFSIIGQLITFIVGCIEIYKNRKIIINSYNKIRSSFSRMRSIVNILRTPVNMPIWIILFFLVTLIVFTLPLTTYNAFYPPKIIISNTTVSHNIPILSIKEDYFNYSNSYNARILFPSEYNNTTVEISCLIPKNFNLTYSKNPEYITTLENYNLSKYVWLTNSDIQISGFIKNFIAPLSVETNSILLDDKLKIYKYIIDVSSDKSYDGQILFDIRCSDCKILQTPPRFSNDIFSSFVSSNAVLTINEGINTYEFKIQSNSRVQPSLNINLNNQMINCSADKPVFSSYYSVMFLNYPANSTG